MTKIRILVVDDSVLIRRMVVEMLAKESDLEVIGTAPNGRLALEKIRQSRPDLVTLDVEMPEMDGLATLKALRQVDPTLPVIMLSSMTERGAAATLDSLLLGARDYVPKPSGPDAAQKLRDELLPKVRALRPAPVRRPGAEVPAHPVAPSGAPPALLVVGASTGGPNALASLLEGMPADLPLPILIVQHMPPVFTRMLADRLATKTGLAVREAVDGEPLIPGIVRVAPGDFHLEPAEGRPQPRLRLHQAPLENSCRPSVDVLFRAAARVSGAGVLGVVLTGMGHDGLQGARAVRATGGAVLVQDEASSVVWGMPGAVVAAGLADRILPPDQLRQEILKRVTAATRAGKRRG